MANGQAIKKAGRDNHLRVFFFAPFFLPLDLKHSVAVICTEFERMVVRVTKRFLWEIFPRMGVLGGEDFVGFGRVSFFYVC